MKIGLHSVDFSYPGQPESTSNTLRQIVQTAEKGGFFSVWPMDHFFQISFHGPPSEPMLETYTTMAFLAGITRKIKLGALVTGVIYRHPGILVKTVTTLDVLSNGRVYLGIGAAWNEQESKGLGIPFPPLKERFERLEETLQIIKQMWSGNVESYGGTYYKLSNPICSPLPVSKPHPPILIGGSGEKKTLKLVAKYADACNIIGMAGNEIIKDKLLVLKKHCEKIGRNYNEIEKTCLKTVDLSNSTQQTTKDIIKDLKELNKIGITHVIYTIRKDYEITPLEVFAEEIIPAVTDL